jgi:hypothetical protein
MTPLHGSCALYITFVFLCFSAHNHGLSILTQHSIFHFQPHDKTLNFYRWSLTSFPLVIFTMPLLRVHRSKCKVRSNPFECHSENVRGSQGLNIEPYEVTRLIQWIWAWAFDGGSKLVLQMRSVEKCKLVDGQLSGRPSEYPNNIWEGGIGTRKDCKSL